MQYWLYLTYILTIIAIIATPGPNALLMVSHSLNSGSRAVFFNAIGSITASAILILLSLLGVKAFIPEDYLAGLSLIGSLYLAYLGITNLRASKIDISLTGGKANRVSNKSFFLQAFFTGISNPKDILFFIILLPQFIDSNLSFFISSTLLLVGWLICDFSIMFAYGVLASKIKKWVDPSKIQLIIKIAGGAILFFAMVLLVTTLNNLYLGGS